MDVILSLDWSVIAAFAAASVAAYSVVQSRKISRVSNSLQADFELSRLTLKQVETLRIEFSREMSKIARVKQSTQAPVSEDLEELMFHYSSIVLLLDREDEKAILLQKSLHQYINFAMNENDENTKNLEEALANLGQRDIGFAASEMLRRMETKAIHSLAKYRNK